MSDHNPEIPTPQTVTVIEPARPAEVRLKRSHIVAACSAGLVGCFFLPWIQFLWTTPTGLDFTKLGDYYAFFWIMPVLAAITAVAGIVGKQYQVVGQLTAIAPFAILIFGVAKTGTELFKAIQFGGWAALGLAVILLIAARK